MRLIFVGTSSFAVPSLERLTARRHQIDVCVTQPDRRQGRGLKLEPSPVKRCAERLGVPLIQPERLNAGLFEDLQPDVGVVAAYGQLVRREVLCLPKYGMLGVHPSLLPKYRGAAPVSWALLDGVATTGVTIFQMDERLDAGAIISQREVLIGAGEDAQSLTDRLAVIGAEELLSALDAVDQGRAVKVPQDEARANLAPKLTKAQGRIDWSQTAEAIERQIRAVIQWPGATTQWNGRPLKVCAASLGSAGSTGTPGTVVRVDPDAVVVATGVGTLQVTELQPAGRRKMRVRDFLAGHAIQVGDRFGARDEGHGTREG